MCDLVWVKVQPEFICDLVWVKVQPDVVHVEQLAGYFHCGQTC